MADFVTVKLDATHPFRRLPKGGKGHVLRIGNDGYGLDLAALADQGPRLLRAKTGDEPDLDVLLTARGLLAKGTDDIWASLPGFAQTHEVEACQDAWATVLNTALAAPTESHKQAMPFYDRPRLFQWRRDGIDVQAPARMSERLRPDRAQRRRDWRRALGTTFSVDWPQTTKAPPRTGQEITGNLLWASKVQQQVGKIAWHDPLAFGFGFDPALDAHAVVIDGLRSDIPLGAGIAFVGGALRINDPTPPPDGIRSYIGSVMLAVAELAVRSAPAESDIAVIAIAGQQRLALLKIGPNDRELNLMAMIQDWPRDPKGIDTGFVWNI